MIDSSQDALGILLEFLRYPLNSSSEILERFASLPNAAVRQGDDIGEFFVFIPGNRSDAATLVAHTDTVFDTHAEHDILMDGDIIRSGNPNYGIGADDRAGCAMLWMLRESGHHLLLVDCEEGVHEQTDEGCVGSRYLMRKHLDIAKIINASSFVLEFDRRLDGLTPGRNYTAYGRTASSDFHSYLETKLGYIEDNGGGYTDIMELCVNVCGANICVGYINAHSEREQMFISNWMHTLDVVGKMLQYPLQHFGKVS